MNYWVILVTLLTLNCFECILSLNTDFSENDPIKNNLTSNENMNVSRQDYNYKQIDGTDYEDEDEEPTFIDKWITIYEHGKNVSINKNVEHINQTFDAIKTLSRNIGYLFKSSVNNRENQKFIEFLSDIDLGLTSDCLSSLIRLVKAFNNYESWALKFLDSWGRPLPSGLVEGVISDFGEYTECIGIESPQIPNSSTIKGQYCLLKPILPFPSPETKGSEIMADINRIYHADSMYIDPLITTMKNLDHALFRMGICVPSQCSATEIQNLFNALLFPITRIPLEVGPNCSVKDERKQLDNYQLFSICFLGITLIVVILSTGYEKYYTKREISLNADKNNIKSFESNNNFNQLLTSFSIIRNTGLLFAKNTRFAALDTIRLISIMYVHFIHNYQLHWVGFGVVTAKKVSTDIFHNYFEDNKYAFMRSRFVLEILLTISGFLMSYNVLRGLEKSKGRTNYLKFIFNKWIRFSVLVFGSIPFFYLFPLMGDGPIWKDYSFTVTPECKNPKTLLKIFLFVYNIFESNGISHHESQMCNPPIYFLSTLLQLSMVGYVLIVVYYRNKFYGLIVNFCALLLGLFASISPKILFNITPVLKVWDNKEETSTLQIWWYISPTNYMTGLFVGMFFGYLMKSNLKISQNKSNLLLVLSLVLIISHFLWNNTFWKIGENASTLNILLYLTVGKLIFCLGIGWITYACSTGIGGYINDILSWRGFHALSRLSFGIYILHFLVVMHRVFTIQYTTVMSDKYLIEHYIIDFIYDIILAFIFYLLIESPFNNIFNYFMAPKKRSIKEQPEPNLTKKSVDVYTIPA